MWDAVQQRYQRQNKPQIIALESHFNQSFNFWCFWYYGVDHRFCLSLEKASCLLRKQDHWRRLCASLIAKFQNSLKAFCDTIFLLSTTLSCYNIGLGDELALRLLHRLFSILKEKANGMPFWTIVNLHQNQPTIQLTKSLRVTILWQYRQLPIWLPKKKKMIAV